MFRAVCAAALALLLSPAAAMAQVKSFADFSGGLNTRNSGILLQENESPALQNVVLDKSGGISRRDGYSKVNPTALGDGATDVNSAYQLERSGGSKYCVSFSSTTGYYSTDGCATNTVFVSTLTRNQDVNCEPYNDKLYCVNNQYNFSFDGSNDAPVSQMPSDVNYIRAFRNRCFVAGKDTNPSRLYWSNLGTCDTWTTASDFVDVDAEDGDVITGIGQDLFDRLIIYKKFSTYLLQFDNVNPSNRRLINVSRTTGAKGQRSVANYMNRQFFLSVGPNGGQPGVYSTDGILVLEDTAKLRGSLDLLSNFYSNIGFRTVDTKADWDAGTFDPRALSSSRDSGFMQSSATTVTDTLSTDFGLGTLTGLTTSQVSGSVSISSAAYIIYNGGFETGSLLYWTCYEGGLSADGSGSCTMVSSGCKEGTYCVDVQNTACSGNQANHLIIRDQNNVSLYDQVPASAGGTTVDLLALGISTQALKIGFQRRCSSGNPYETELLSTTFTAISSVTWVSNSVFNDESTWGSIDGVKVNRYFSHHESSATAVFVSRAFDMGVSTPIGGPFYANVSSGGPTGIAFGIHSATSTSGEYTAYQSVSSGTRITETRPFYQYISTFTTSIGTMTPTMNSVSFVAASTGVWRSPELFLSLGMTSFGLFRSDSVTSGSQASVAYSMAISTYQGGTASTGTIVVTPGQTIAHSTGAYVMVIATYTVASGSDTAKDDAIVINWNEGTAAKSATMAVYKGRLHVCGQSASGPVNDVCYVRDENGAWVKWTGINARHLNVIAQNFYATGSSETAGGFIYKLYNTDSDAGAPIHAYWESKDHPLGSIQNVKALDRIYVLGSNDATTITATVKADSGLRSAAYDLNLSTGAAFRIIQKSLTPINGNTFRMNFSNNAASKPWSIFGFGLLFRDLGLMQP